MAAPTSLAVTLDLVEYSRYEVEEGRSVITATIVASGGGDMSGEQVTIELLKARRARDAAIYTTSHTVATTADPYIFTVTIDLPSLMDSDEISLIRRGFFFVRATSVTDTNVIGNSSDISINPVTAQQLRSTYLFGLKLDASDVRDVKNQPTQITGVEVVEVSTTHPTGFDVLNYRYDGVNGIRHISWGKGGPLVAISGVGRYVLRHGCKANDYIIIQVRDLTDLPTTNEMEELLIDKDTISDTMLRRWLNQACDWLENDKIAGVYLEPTLVATEPTNSSGTTLDWDFLVPAITYYPITPYKWIDILFPYMSLLKINELFGQLGASRIVDINQDWIEISEKNGFVQLVPYHQELAFTYLGLVWVESLRGRIDLPNFWHFNAKAGLRQVDPVLLEVIGKKAGIDALTIAGQAFRGGFSSQSISRDGVSESVSYTASAIYGIYSATIEEFSKFINKEIKQIKGRYRGVNMLVA